MTVGQTMVPRPRRHVTTPKQLSGDMVTLMSRYGFHQVPVVLGERLVGKISRDVIVCFLEVRRGLGLQEDEQGVEKPLRLTS